MLVLDILNLNQIDKPDVDKSPGSSDLCLTTLGENSQEIIELVAESITCHSKDSARGQSDR